MTLFTVIPRILKHMAHLSPIDAEYEKLLSTLTTLADDSSSEATSELTGEEVKLAKILVPITKAFQTLFAAIVAQNSNSPTKVEPAKTAAAIKELLSSAATLLKREGAIKSTGVIPWQTFHSLTTIVETVAYLNVTNQCLVNLIATKANKKAAFKAVNVVIQDFMAQCRQTLQAVQTDITALRNVVKPDRVKSGLLYEICDGSAFDFVRSPVSCLSS
jgi:N-terminal acetyltransferase B complex non-catalytic subunit